MSLYQASIPQFTKMLGCLESYLTIAGENAKFRNFDENVFVNSRLAPDQYAFARQIQATCDAAKFAAARLSGKEAPAHPDTETTMDELRARVAKAKAFVESIKEEDFAGASERIVPLSFMPGKGMLGSDYLFEMALPNFYFHLTTAYAILRHNGVPLGKMNFIGSITLKDL